MRILIVQDSFSWAINQLSQVIVRNNNHLNIKVIAIHPKELRANPEKGMETFEKEVIEFNPDVIHFQYWDIANTLSKSPVCRDRKIIIIHHNQKNLLSHDWRNFDMIVVHTKKSYDTLTEAGYWNVEIIQHGIDVEKFKYLENYDSNIRMLGYTGRIVPWKGLYEILKVGKEIDSEVIMQGKLDKPDYWQKCLEFDEQMDIRFNTPAEEQVNVYHEMGIYVGNSSDNIEEGTLGLLEAMASGIPVVTTPSGEAKDIIEDGVNGILVEFENYDSLKNGIERMLKMDRNKIRENAWNTVRVMNEQVMARKYEKLYWKLAYPQDLVSVIIPTCNRPGTITQILDGYKAQTYFPIELIVIDDSKTDIEKNRQILEDWKAKNGDVAIKLIGQYSDGYGLAESRNRGIFEASGHYLIFNDDRFYPDPTAVSAFVGKIKTIKDKVAVFGDKGADKKTFVENFFIIRKKDIADAGMFNERINEYGGQSQEIRERLEHQGFRLVYEPSARSNALFGTHNRNSKRYEVLRSKIKLWLLRN